MAAMSVTAKVRKDGSLVIPRKAREELDEGTKALLGLIGIAGGGRPDGSVNHDKYLYGPDPE